MARGKKDPINKKTRQTLTQLANQYFVYRERLGERMTFSKDEKIGKLREFFELYTEELMAAFKEVYNVWHDAHPDAAKPSMRDIGDECNLTEDQRRVLLEFLKVKKNKDDKMVGFDEGQVNLAIFSTFAKEAMYKKTKYGATADMGKGEGISPEAEKGRKDIVKWLYKHSEIRTAAKEGGKRLGSRSQMGFIEAIVHRSPVQQCAIFYLVCKGHSKAGSDQDFEEASTKGPTLEEFRSKIQKSRWKFWTRITGEKIDWEMLSQAIVQVDERLHYGGSGIQSYTEENKKDVAELKKQYQQNDPNTGRKKNFENDPDEAMIEEIERRIKKLQDAGGEPDKDQLETLYNDLNTVLQNQGKLIDKKSEGMDEGTSFFIDTAASVMRSASTALENAHIMKGMSGLAMITDVASIIFKMKSLIKDGEQLNPNEAAKRMLQISQSAINIGQNVDRIIELGKFVEAGGKVKEAGDALAGSMGTFATALSVATGAINIAKGSLEMDQARKIKSSSNKSKEMLSQAQNKEGDDDLYAEDLTQYAHSMYKSRAIRAGYNIISGAVGTISGVLNLTGLGAIVGMPLTALSYTITGIGTLVKMLTNKKETRKSIDRFLGVDMAIDNIKKRFDDYNEKKTKYKDVYSGQEVTSKVKPLKLDKDMEKDIRTELRGFGESLIGVTSDGACINYVQNRYANYLWDRTFVKPQGTGYWKADDYNGVLDQQSDDKDIIRYACKELVTGIGTTPRFSQTGLDKPKTSPSEIKRRLNIG